MFLSIFIPIFFSITIAGSSVPHGMVTAFNPVPITQETPPVEKNNEKGNSDKTSEVSGETNNSNQQLIDSTIEKGEDNTDSTNSAEEKVARKNPELFVPDELLRKKLGSIQDSNMFLVNTEDSAKRIEIIHTKDVSPSITLVSPSGSIYTDTDAQNKIIIKSDIVIQSHPTLSYSVVYLPQTPDGHWKLSVAGVHGVNELIAVSSKYSSNTAQPVERVMYPDELITWYLSDSSVYTEESLVDITAEETQNGRQPVTPKDEDLEDESTNTGAITFVGILLCIVFFFLYRKSKKTKEKNAEKKREARIKAANEAMKEKRAHENEELAEIIAAHENEYIDYPEEIDYRKWQPENIPDTPYKYEEQKNTETKRAGQKPPEPPTTPVAPTTTQQPFVPDNSSIFF